MYFCFNPRARAGRDFPHRAASNRPDSVSIHAPARGATLWSSGSIREYRSFNPRARAGRDLYSISISTIKHVSIHAPARGATFCFFPDVFHFLVSIHAPARGATLPLTTLALLIFVFQSTRPRGARRRSWHCWPSPALVSIHAPARGATWLPRIYSWADFSFNPRARAGRDVNLRIAMIKRFVSIHAPARGATICRALLAPHSTLVSIHAPARGATAGHTKHIPLEQFQSTRPRGARRRGRPTRSLNGLFQSTRPRGARPYLPYVRGPVESFNPRARAGRDVVGA